MKEAIAEKHASLISGLTRLYSVLVAMRYISVSDVIQPTHTAEAISAHTFQELLGYESETVQLMRLMPVLRTEVAWGWDQEGVEILPGSKVVNYFINHDTDWIDYLRYGYNRFSEDTKLLPPWMLRLTIGDMYSGQNGIDLIYDTKTQTIIEWGHTNAKLWDEAPSRPADKVLAEIVDNFMNLEWIPHMNLDNRRARSNMVSENPIRRLFAQCRGTQLPLEPRLAIEQLRLELGEQSVSGWREPINRWKSMQKLYEDCGWGTEKYDGEELVKRREEMFKRLSEVERRTHGARRRVLAHGGDVEAARREMTVARESFWAEYAGANAV